MRESPTEYRNQGHWLAVMIDSIGAAAFGVMVVAVRQIFGHRQHSIDIIARMRDLVFSSRASSSARTATSTMTFRNAPLAQAVGL